MARGRAVIIAASIALTAIVALSLLVTAGVEASSADKELASAPVFGGPLLEINPLSIDAVPPAQTILTCTTTITTPNSDVTNNFSIASASSVFLLPYNNLSMMIPGVPPGVTVTVNTQYFRLDAVGGQHYIVSAQPNTGSSYNLSINVYDPGGTRVYTGTKPLSDLGIIIDYVPAQTATYYFAIFHQGSNCPPSGTYRLTVSGPLANTPTSTHTPGPTPTPTTPVTPIPGADRYEPNFNFDGASLLALDVKYANLNFAPWAGSDPNAPDNDFYRVYVKPGLRVTCETLDLAPGVDTNLILYDNNYNGIGGNEDIDRAGGNFASRVTYYVTYEGWLYALVGNVYPIDPRVAATYTYSFHCYIGSGPTATPTNTRVPVTPPTPIPTNTPTPSLVPTLTPTPTPTPPFIVVNPLPTATPVGQQAIVVPISLVVYYDLNNNRSSDPGEGVVGISARVIDVITGQELQHGFTDVNGFVSLTTQATGIVRLVVPYLSYSVVIQPSGSQITLRIAPSGLPNSIP